MIGGKTGELVVAFPGNKFGDDRLDETTRRRRLYAWADDILKTLGLLDKIEQASIPTDLKKIKFDINAVEISLAIQAALFPEGGGERAAHFVGLKAAELKRIIQAGFNEAIRMRSQELARGSDNKSGNTSSAPYYDWTADLLTDEDGIPLPLLANAILYLQHHPRWRNVFAFDQFAHRVVIREAPPWGASVVDARVTDQDESKTRVWFQREDLKLGVGDIGRAIQAVAKDHCFHQVREYLEGVKWDGTPRIDHWLTTYFHAEDTQYIRAIGPRYLTSGVARIYDPGCKVDYTAVFEGPQGKLKSETLRALAVRDAWFMDRLSHVGGKDAMIEVAGKWIIELAELDALTRAADSAIKAFLTKRFDDFRPPWGKHAINQPRQCIFAGTINPPIGGYLTDPTGARRIWPVACEGDIDLAGVTRDRDQLWAEAVVRFKAAATWWLETPDLEALAAIEQDARYKIDVWQETVEKWLDGRKDTSVAEVLKGALGINPKDSNAQTAMNRVAKILTRPRLGFTKYYAGSDGARQNRYRRYEAPELKAAAIEPNAVEPKKAKPKKAATKKTKAEKRTKKPTPTVTSVT
jgi:predicted P-loop ATPase